MALKARVAEDASRRFGLGRPRLAQLAGPLLTALTLAGFEALDRAGFPAPHLTAVCLTMVGFSAFVGGLGPGMASAGLAMAYAVTSALGITGAPVRFSAFANLQRQTALLITAPLVALMVGILRDWHRRAIVRGLQEGMAERDLRVRQTDALLEIARVVGGTIDLQEALRRICRQLQRLTGADTVAAYTLAPDRASLRPVAAYHVPRDRLAQVAAAALPLADVQELATGVMNEGRVAWTTDARADPRFRFGLFGEAPHQSAVAVPLVLDGSVSGAFYLVWWTARHEPSGEQLATLQSVGEQTGILLRNAGLYEDLETRAARLRTLSRLNQRVSGSLDTDAVLADIARAAAELMQVPLGVVWVADDDGQRLEATAFSDPSLAADYPARSLAGAGGATAWVARQRIALAVDDVAADPRFAPFDWWQARQLASAYQVPIALGERLLGVLALHGTRPLRPTPDEVEALDSFVVQAALAIRNACLYDEASAHARRLEILTGLTRAIAASLEPDVILRQVAESAVALFPDAGCRLWTGAGDQLELRAESGTRGIAAGRALERPPGESLVGRVWASRQPLFLEDVLAVHEPDDAGWMRSQGFVSGAALPLLAGGRAVGVFALLTRTRYRWTASEVSLLEAFAEHAAVALEKARLFGDTQDRRQLTENLYALKVAMERTIDVPGRARIFVERASGALGFDGCSVLLATEDGRAVELVAGTGHPESGPPVQVPLDAGGGIQVVWQSGRTLVVASEGDHAALPPMDPALAQVSALQARRFALVPLTFQDRPIGVVAVHQRSSSRPLTARSIGQLELFCQALAASVVNARLYAETQQREQVARALFAATRRLAATLDLEAILDVVTDSVIDALGCDAAAFYRWDPVREGVVFVRGRHLPAELVRELLLRPHQGIGGRSYAERRPVWTSDLHADPSLGFTEAELERYRQLGAPRGILGLPVMMSDEVFGVLQASYRQPHAWTEREVRLGSALAAQAAVAIQNARLYAETQQNLAGAALLNNAARTLHRTLDVRRLLPEALRELGQTFGAHGTAAVLFESGSAEAVFRWGEVDDESACALADPLRRRETPMLVPSGGGPCTAAAFPLRGRARVLGGLCLLFLARRVIPESETRLLSAYADQLAMALENTRLFEEAENKRTQLEQVFASTSDGFLVLDLEGRVLGLNRQGARLLGVAPTEVTGYPVAQIVEATRDVLDWGAAGARALAERMAAPGEGSGDLEIRAPGGPRTVSWRATPTRDLLGAAVGLTVTLRDVTREREVDRMKTDFVSVVSHELRTPLTSIKGSLHLLVAEPEVAGDDTRRSLLEISIKNTDRLIRLINDILDISRIEAGHIQLHLGHHRPAAFVAVAVDGIAALAEARSIAIEREMALDLPAVHVDFDRMVQVVTNLLSNAIKFSPPGEPVRISATARDGGVELRVTDRGRGIAPEDVKRLFTKFQQLDSGPARAVGGSGLGLAICRGIVEEHGGRISVESRPGAGASFIVRLPAAAAAEPTRPAEPPPAAAPLILVVDDERDLRELLRDMLEEAGFRVMEARRALDGVELARVHRPDLITMDVMMPDLDGFEAVRLLRQTPETRHVPVIMVSGVEFDAGMVRTLGSTALLNKPFTDTELLETVHAQLGRGREVRR